MMASLFSFEGETNQAHPEPFVTKPSQLVVGAPKAGQLTQQQISSYFDDGFLVLEDFFSVEELDPCRRGLDDLVNDMAQRLYKAGKISRLYEEEGLFTRMTKINEEFPGAAVILHKQQKMPKAVQQLWANEKLLNVMEQLLGPDVDGHPVWNLRVKVPNNLEAVVPWHQDVAYFDNKSYNVLIPTAWIPFLDVDYNNGCMQFFKGGHKTGRVVRHTCCEGPTWYVMADVRDIRDTLGVNLKDDLVTVNLKYGSLVLFSNIIPHRSVHNVSSDIRWSVDLRYFDPKKPDGFFNLKPSIPFRRKDQPDLKPDFDAFFAVDRNAVSAEFSGQDFDPFDPVIHGPWMKRWAITHQNKHTEAFNREQELLIGGKDASRS